MRTASLLSFISGFKIIVKTIFTIVAVSMFVILFGFIAIAPTNAFADIEFEEKEFTQKYAPDRLLIKFKNDVSESHKKQTIHGNGGLISDEIPQIKVKIIKVPPHALEKIQTALSKHFAVEYVEKDFMFEPEMIPNDPTYPSQYHLPTIQAAAPATLVPCPQTLASVQSSLLS